jgi:hypothetical protein
MCHDGIHRRGRAGIEPHGGSRWVRELRQPRFKAGSTVSNWSVMREVLLQNNCRYPELGDYNQQSYLPFEILPTSMSVLSYSEEPENFRQ